MSRSHSGPLPPREVKRLKTLRKNKSQEAIVADLRRAGRMAGTHFTSESGKRANDIRWAAHRAAKAAKKAAENKGE